MTPACNCHEGNLELYTEVADPDRLLPHPLVSVVMITFNHGPYIAQAIQGVLCQETDFPVELIVGEDCSTDQTREIVLDFQRRYPEQIRILFTEKNVGAHKNFRRTALAARGKYMAFCEGDDWWHRKDKLQLQVDTLRADESLVGVAGGFRDISAEGEVMAPEKQSNSGLPPIRVEYQDHIFHTVICYTCTVVARTDAVRRALLGDTLCQDRSQLMGDHPLWLELSQLGQMVYFRETLASYRHSPNSASRQGDPLRTAYFEMSFFDINFRALQRYALPGDPIKTSRAQVSFARQILLHAAWLGEAKVAMNQLKRLRRLGETVGWREVNCLFLASIPLPRSWLRSVYTRIAPQLERKGLNLIKRFAGQPLFKPRDEKQ